MSAIEPQFISTPECDCILHGDEAEDAPDQYHQLRCARRRQYTDGRGGWPADA